MIVTKDLTKKFGKFTAVDCLNLNIAKGESYGFLRPQWCRKNHHPIDAAWHPPSHLWRSLY